MTLSSKSHLEDEASRLLNKTKTARLKRLISKGTPNLAYKEGSEYARLMFEIVDKKEALGEFNTPFDGRCRRCGVEFDDPVPENSIPSGNTDIASAEWCADCNTFVMSVVFRESSVYRKGKGELFDPLKGGKHANT